MAQTKRRKVSRAQKLSPVNRTNKFAKVYLLLALAILVGTTIFWSALSAGVELGNADQLINPYLMQHASTFKAALLPGQHSFLIKWPIFLIIDLFHASATSFDVLTVLTVLLTVVIFILVLYRIERRPFYLGTLCLALAAMLLLVPAQPYAGGILPVNMAMVATRNLEYVAFIGCLILLVRSHNFRSRSFWLGVIGLAVLSASDRLFLILSIFGPIAALVVYAVSSRWRLASINAYWFIAAAFSAVGSLIILWVINVTHLTSTTNQVGTYGLVHNLHDLLLGIGYSITGLFTNFGANPGFDSTTIRSLPHDVFTRLFSVSGPAYVVNAILLVIGLVASTALMMKSLGIKNRIKIPSWDSWTNLAVVLLWSSIAATGVFIFTNHAYPVDARYLTIWLFAVFVCLAAISRHYKFSTRIITTTGLVLCVAIALGLVGSWRTAADERQGLSGINNNDHLIASVLQRHAAVTLVGDYWRVVPTKLDSNNSLNVLPLQDCTQPRTLLSSSDWNNNYTAHPFVYLLSFNHSLTDYPNCTLNQVINAYGRPNESVLIAGTLNNPQEKLLFYDQGARVSAPKSSSTTPSTVLPVDISQLTNTSCTNPTILTVVAHQDDDLLFMNPDLLNAIKNGYCVRTVYMTAGDNGFNSFYWLGREKGSETAYSYMANLGKTLWISRIVSITDSEYVTVANPKGNTKISLIFMHLPDGNVNGQGFASSHFESLARLESNAVKTIQTVDQQSTYTYPQVISALDTIMHTYQPTEIRTQANFISRQYPDHSDHMAVGRYVKKAYAKYETEQYANQVVIPISFYIGYPIHAMPPNVSGASLIAKQTAFLDYAVHDPGVCTATPCVPSNTYLGYLQRQYQNSY